MKGGVKNLLGKMIEQWGKLKRDDLCAWKGRHEQIVAKLQIQYGVSRWKVAKEKETKLLIAKRGVPL